MPLPDCVRSAVRVRCERRFGWQHFSCLRFAHNEGVESTSPPLGRVLRSISVCCASYLPSFAFHVRWGYALLAITSAHRLGPAFDGCVLCSPAPPPIIRVAFGMPAATPTRRSPLAFDGCIVRICCLMGVRPLPLIRVSRSVRLCRAGHYPHLSFVSPVQQVSAGYHLHLSFASRVPWVCVSQRSPLPLVRVRVR